MWLNMTGWHFFQFVYTFFQILGQSISGQGKDCQTIRIGYYPKAINFRIQIFSMSICANSQIVHHYPCFNLFILHNNLFNNQGSEINKNDIFLHFNILSFTKTFFLLHIHIYIYIYRVVRGWWEISGAVGADIYIY